MSAETTAAWRIKNPDRVKEYSQRCQAKESSKQKQREWKAANKDKVLAASKKWREKNHTRHLAAMKKWRDKNRDYINTKDRERTASDPSYKIARMLRNQVRSCIREASTKKAASTKSLTGCDIRFLMGYLEARFKPGMKWSNYGSVWEIDHRIPCASFDMTDESHQRSCFHYSNLQPLFVADNRKKKDSMPGPHQAELL